MFHRQPSKVYTKSSLCAWMDKLSKFCAWELMFQADVIALGKKFLKENVLREVEIFDSYASISAKLNDEKYYCIIDWDNNMERPIFKTSQQEDNVKYSIVVAGLLFIEEIVVEQINDLLIKDRAKYKPEAYEISESQNLIAEQLFVHFEIVNQRLVMTPKWSTGDSIIDILISTKKVEALDDEKKRGAILRILFHIQKSNFRFDPLNKWYFIDDLTIANNFVRRSLKDWVSYFHVTLDESIKFLFSAVKTVSLHATVSDISNKQIRIDFTAENFEISEPFLQQIFKNKNHPIFVQNVGLIQLDKKTYDDLYDFWNKVDENSSVVLPKYMFFSLFNAKTVKFTIPDDLLSINNNKLLLPDFLKEFQKDGVKWMRNLLDSGCHCLLADEMGLGKTVQVLSLIFSSNCEVNNKQLTDNKKISIVICPASVISVWEHEIRKFFPCISVKILSNNVFLEDNCDVLLASYTQVRRNKKILEQKFFKYIILDEAQYIKNSKSKTAYACYALAGEFRVALTGTPIENNLFDLWSIFKFLMPGLLCDRNIFYAFLDDEKFRKKLKQQISPFVLRRTKQSINLQLPSKQEIDLFCGFSDEQRKIYSELQMYASEYLNNLNDKNLGNNRFNVLTILMRLRQVVTHPHLVTKLDYNDSFAVSPKLELLFLKLYEIFSSDKKVVIFSQFLWFLDEIEKNITSQFPNVNISKLIGSTTNRSEVVKNFQENKESAVMLISLKAGGVGLTLHAAEYVFLMEPWWNPAIEQQAIARAHRIGQDKQVTVYRFLTKDSIEERMRELQTNKLFLFDEFISEKNLSKSLSNFYLENVSELIR